MRSIPGAMIGEILTRGRWSLILGVLAANALPVVVFSALRYHGVIEIDAEVNRALHTNLVLINVFTFGVAFMGAQGPPSRLYLYPIRTSTLVALQMFPAMIVMGIEVVLSTLLVSGLFQLNWPIWGPALFVSVFMTACMATFWYTEKSAWSVPVLSVVTVALGFWYTQRFSYGVSNWPAGIPELIPLEVGLLALVVVASYIVGVKGVARNRYGETIPSLGIVDWILRMLDLESQSTTRFKSADEAQDWHEWQTKGWAMPVIVVFGATLMLSIWGIANRSPRDLVDGFMAGGALLSVAGMIVGMIVGSPRQNDPTFEMGSFLSTRPITSVAMARSTLKVAFKSILVGWLIWASLFALVAAILFATGFAPSPFFPPGFRWWWGPATLVGCWTVVSIVATTMMTGRAKEVVGLACGALASYIAAVIYCEFAIPPDPRRQLFHGFLVAVSAVMVLVSAGVLVIARRRQVINSLSAALAVLVWCLLSSVWLWEWSHDHRERLPAYVFAIGLGALTVIPFAAAPLSVAWNRSR